MSDRSFPGPSWPDERLVKECLGGNEEAWGALVDKYKNLVYSVILKYRAGSEEAADLFQAVWLDAYNDLAKLKKPEAVKAWLVTMTTHKCYHWKKKQKRQEFHESSDVDAEDIEMEAIEAPSFLEEVERDQQVREAVLSLTPRCQEMIQLLFFTSPPLPYKEVAERLGLATGSIGFIRGRCLQRLQKALEKEGF
jgi:RNA polymerase sigma factor (sigma-70 family)